MTRNEIKGYAVAFMIFASAMGALFYMTSPSAQYNSPDTPKNETFANRKPVPYSYYVPDYNGGFVSIKIKEFQWNADHSLVCIPRDRKRKVYTCIPPKMVEFQ